jgi:Tfp pilus assembly protein PilO
MADMKDTRRKLKIAIGVMLGLDVLALAVLISPLVGSTESRRQRMTDLWQELQTKTKQVEPLRGLDKKIIHAKGQIDDFYKDRLPAQDSAVSSALGKLAQQSGVQIGQLKYSLKDPDPSGLRPMFIEAELSGDYLQLVRFINALERDKNFFIIDSVDLGGDQGGVVKLAMKMETFFRSSTAS